MEEHRYFELSELLEEANRLREADAELRDTAPFNPRTIYYYVQQGLLPDRARRRGPGTVYAEDFLYRLLTIRRLQKSQALSLTEIGSTLGQLTEDTLRRVALGEEPLEVRSPGSLEEARAMAAGRKDQVLWLGESHAAFNLKPPPAIASRNVAASERTVRDTRRPLKKSPELLASLGSPEDPGTRRFTYPLGEHAELVLKKPVTAQQARQLEHIAGLVQTILDEASSSVADANTKDDD